MATLWAFLFEIKGAPFFSFTPAPSASPLPSFHLPCILQVKNEILTLARLDQFLMFRIQEIVIQSGNNCLKDYCLYKLLGIFPFDYHVC